jgi:membrane-associated phospholipid phosphatase
MAGGGRPPGQPILAIRLRVSKIIKTVGWGAVIAGAAAPLIRRRVKLSRSVVIGAAAAAPAALCVVRPKTPLRDVSVCALQMWAYLAAYEMPNDDPEKLRERVHVTFPINIDRVLGLGKIPSERLQNALASKGDIRKPERVLVWSHWVWFTVPHTALFYVWLRRRSQLASAAARVYAVFDIGAMLYWLVPTAPPWWAAEQGALDLPDSDGQLPLRRMMYEYGEKFWGNHWTRLFGFLGGNPLAAFPSLHFATSLMAARVLSEIDPVAGAVGFAYAGTLGFALVYLGEHYVTDLIAGAALASGVQLASRPVSLYARRFADTLDALRRLGEAQ